MLSPPKIPDFSSPIAIWEAVVLDPLSLVSMAPLRLLVISSTGIELITLEPHTVLTDTNCTHSLLAETPYPNCTPWYHLTVSGTGRPALWFAIDNWRRPEPQLVSMAVNPPPSESSTPLITWMKEELTDSPLWEFPSVDFDEALGFTVLGNCFGELTICDHAWSDPSDCSAFDERLFPLHELRHTDWET